MTTYQDDYKDQNDSDTGNDQLGENREQTPLANAVHEDRAEGQGWDSNQRIPTVTPADDNGTAGPDDLIDDNRINGAMSPQDAGYSPDEDATDDDDLIDNDDYDLLDDDDDDELIPIETDDDEDADGDDDDLDLEDDTDEDDKDFDPAADRPTTFEANTDFASRDHGRVTGTMLDHEPGLPGSGRI